jgi:hypothetical protein
MKAAVDFPQPLRFHMRVNFRRADVGMAEKFLNDPQVSPVLQQMRGKTVPEHVRRDIFSNISPRHPPFDPQP